MTSRLDIQLESHSHLPDWNQGVPVVAEVIDSRLKTVDSVTFIGNTSLPVEPGFYLVRARLPSGETVSAQTLVREGESERVMLHPSYSAHEWLAWQHFLGEVPTSPSDLNLDNFPDLWLRLWYLEENEWKVKPSEYWSAYRPKDRKIALFELDLSRNNPREQFQRLRLAQVGGQEVPWRFISIPPTPHIVQVLLRASRTPTQLNGGLVVKVASQDWRAETLSHYLRSGAEERAGEVAQPVVGQAEEFAYLPPMEDAQLAEEILRSKHNNPFGAAVGGYYLLRAGDYEHMHTWPHNFAEWIKWLPDAAVIHAWQLIRQGEEALSQKDRDRGVRPMEKARQRLIQASHSNLPVLTEGVRLLVDGLEAFKLSARGNEAKEELIEALKRTRGLAKAVDWNQRLTTYYGPHPTEASLTPVIGVPQDPDSLTFV